MLTLEARPAGGVYAQLVRRQLQPSAAAAAPSDPAKAFSPGPFAAVAFEAGSPEDQLLTSFSDAAAAAGEDRNAVAADAQVDARVCFILWEVATACLPGGFRVVSSGGFWGRSWLAVRLTL